MSSPEVDSTPEPLPGASEALPSAPPTVEPSSLVEASPGRIRAFAMAAGLLAGLASWPVCETAVYDRFIPAPAASTGIPTLAEATAAAASQQAGVLKEATIAHGLLGAALGAVLGLAGGLAGRASRRVAPVVAAGAILGGAAGAIGAQIGVWTLERAQAPGDDDLLIAILAHGLIAAMIGAAGGWAFATGAGGRNRTRAMIGGAVGGVGGIVAYQVLGAVAFPLADTARPFASDATARLCGQLLLAGLVGAGAGLGLADSPRSR